jgi:glutamyl-tRNA reductase
MRINPNESMKSWAARVEMFEKGRAMQRIAQGEDVEKVIEEMSKRIRDKILHPILDSIHNSISHIHDVEKSRKEYNEKMKNIGKAADHVDGNS